MIYDLRFMEKQEIIDKVNRLLAEEFEIDAALLKPEASLKDDLEIDSLDFVDIVVLVDSEFGFKSQTEAFKTMKTLQDFYDYIDKSVNC